ALPILRGVAAEPAGCPLVRPEGSPPSGRHVAGGSGPRSLRLPAVLRRVGRVGGRTRRVAAGAYPGQGSPPRVGCRQREGGGAAVSALVPAIHAWPTNGDLIADVAKLYDFGKSVLDATYGRGRFWTKYRPVGLVRNDIDPASPVDFHFDFRDLPWGDETFDTEAIDPPYKLSGTLALGEFDRRFGLNPLNRDEARC